MKRYLLGGAPEDGVGFGTTDLEYIQDGLLMAQIAMVERLLPDGYSHPVIIKGVIVTKTSNDYTHTAGLIYYQGDIYTVDALTTILTSVTPPNFKVIIVPAADNSVVFDNGNSYDIDLDYKMILVDGATSGAAAYNEIRRLEHIEFNRRKEIGESITLLKLPTVGFLSDNFDSSGLGIPFGRWEGFALATGNNSTIDMQGFTLIGFNFKVDALAKVRGIGDYLAATIGQWVGEMTHLLTGRESGVQDHTHPYEDSKANNHIAQGGGSSGTDENDVLRTTGGSGHHDALDEHENRQPSVVCVIIQKVFDIAA